jgi:hypothetical protein
MALHVPTHRAGFTGDHLVRDVMAAVLVAVVLIATIGIVTSVKISVGPVTGVTEEAQALQEFRAGERADWAATVPAEASSLIEFRASERTGR